MMIFSIFLVLFIAFYNPVVKGATDVKEFLKGKNYTKGKYAERFLYLTSLKDGYTLESRDEAHPELVDATAPPYEATRRVFIIKSRKIIGKKIIKKITSLNDFENFVQIDTEEKAIEFVRFRTSEYTYFFFRPEIAVEVFKGVRKDASKGLGEDWTVGEATSDFFEKHKLKELECSKKEGYFEINRYLIVSLWPGAGGYPDVPILYKVVEKVYKNGKYEEQRQIILKGIDFQDIPYPLEPM